MLIKKKSPQMKEPIKRESMTYSEKKTISKTDFRDRGQGWDNNKGKKSMSKTSKSSERSWRIQVSKVMGWKKIRF